MFGRVETPCSPHRREDCHIFEFEGCRTTLDTSTSASDWTKIDGKHPRKSCSINVPPGLRNGPWRHVFIFVFIRKTTLFYELFNIKNKVF